MTLFLGLLLILPPLDDSLTIRFIGNAAFEITDGRTTLITDFPYRSGAFGYMTYDPSIVRPAGTVYLLITHAHKDHFDPDLPRDPSWKVVGSLESTAGVSKSSVLLVDPTLTVAGIRIVSIPTDHCPGHRSYRVEWKGKVFYFTGDTEDPKPILAEKGLDYAFVTPWILEAVKKSRRSINARNSVIHHHTAGQRIEAAESCWIPLQNEIKEVQ